MRPEFLALLALGALSGCASLPRPAERAPDPGPTLESIQAAQLNSYAADLLKVVSGSVTEQAEVMAEARARYEQARLGPAALRLGLLLAAPVHPARDPVQAQLLLRETLTRPELLTVVERALATVELERLSAELRSSGENERLAAEVRQERDRQRTAPTGAALTRQVQTLTEQNAQLRRSLEEVRAKLDAIAEFERRQADRPPASEGRNP